MSGLSSASPSLCLLGGFSLIVGDRSVALGSSGRRVLAYLALSDKPVTRSRLARSLWPEQADDRARANLRSAIWRMPSEGRGMMLEDGTFLSLDAATTIDAARIVVDEISIIGSRCGRFKPALDLLAKSAVDVNSLISEQYSLSEGIQAMERAGARGVLKVLLRPST